MPKKERIFFVHIMASRPYGTLYVGVTNNLVRRVFEHKEGMADGFTKKYKINKLVYYEAVGDAMAAITREKQLKKRYRAWKIRLIESANPHWRDLYDDIL